MAKSHRMNWKQFRNLMKADNWQYVDDVFIHANTGAKFEPFTLKHGGEQWEVFADAGQTPAPF